MTSIKRVRRNWKTTK